MKKMIFLKVFFIIILFIHYLIIACNKNNDNDNNSIYGTWILTNVKTAQGVNSYPDSLENTISITLTDSSFILLDGYCNGGTGKFNVSGDKITFYDIQMTEMGCLMVGWENYLKELCIAKSYKIEQNQLLIFIEKEYYLVFMPR